MCDMMCHTPICYDCFRVTNTNGSGETKFELADLQLTNLLPNCKYKHVLGRYTEVKDKFDRDVMLRYDVIPVVDCAIGDSLKCTLHANSRFDDFA